MTTAIVGFPTAHDHLGRAASSANVIQFPADRCRRPATVIEAAERAAYEQAAIRFTVPETKATAIEAMMRLACEGTCDVVRPLAEAWLLVNVGVLVCHDAT